LKCLLASILLNCLYNLFCNITYSGFKPAAHNAIFRAESYIRSSKLLELHHTARRISSNLFDCMRSDARKNHVVCCRFKNCFKIDK